MEANEEQQTPNEFLRIFKFLVQIHCHFCSNIAASSYSANSLFPASLTYAVVVQDLRAAGNLAGRLGCAGTPAHLYPTTLPVPDTEEQRVRTPPSKLNGRPVILGLATLSKPWTKSVHESTLVLSLIDCSRPWCRMAITDQPLEAAAKTAGDSAVAPPFLACKCLSCDARSLRCHAACGS
jgi:hypothetical protein